MKKVSLFLQRNATKMKSIFFIAVSLLVFVELRRLVRTISWSGVISSLSQISWFHIFLMVIIGLLAILPMVGYDFIFNRTINSQHSKQYIAETSWAINTMNNLVGFFGIVDVGLRYSFYIEDGKELDGAQQISKVTPYFMTGLSLLSGLSLMLLYFWPNPSSASRYWPILVAIVAYLRVILLISSQKKWAFFGQLPKRTAGQLIFISFLEWSAFFLSFLFVGRLAGYSVPIVDLFPIFIIAHCVGMISMIPGGIGSFDLVLISGLASAGLHSTDAVVWLLLFRLVYYILPFLIGIFIFSKQMGHRLNQLFFGLPEKIASNIVHIAEIWSFRAFGFFFILSALIPEKTTGLIWLNAIDPMRGELIWQLPSIILGLLFIILARFIQRRIHSALSFGILLIAISLIYVNSSDILVGTSLFLCLLLFILIALRKRLMRSYFSYTWEDLTVDISFASFSFLIFLILGGHSFWKIYPIHHLNPLDHTLQLLGVTFLCVLLVYLIIRLILRCFRGRPVVFGQAFEVERFTKFLKTYGGDSDSGLAFLRDKRLFWYQVEGQDKVAFQFAQLDGKCVVMGEPIGDKNYFPQAIEYFLREAEEQNVDVIFYEIKQETTLLLHDHGYDFLKFGESATIPLAEFGTEGKSGKKFRTSLNKLENHGYHFDMIYPPYSEETLDRLEYISNQWLGNRQEKGFSLGFFDRDYLQLAPIALVRGKDDKVLAFATIMPSFQEKVGTIDLMRYDSDTAPNGVMEYLFIRIALYFKEEGKDYFDIGMAPLSNVGTRDHSFWQEKVGYLIYQFTSRFYSFSGLRKYKEKFRPDWEAKYISYPRSTWLAYAMLVLLQIDNRKVKPK
ncbi:bifunctional lysylphosphatidylglycerol flippase/synthetase MprF [Streptococcus suis]|uniref:Phosphatidylglycerol lysyltransferase n=1 Tax=Streptococcus suis TaxID=1307 RepID=A0A116M6K4_STRSU|nr:bifunctional lysylphosphatidylglycerol flippase/synthetase MprF [Streptococcus suis]NQH17359.1 bifunctional lysylphosphatidylglycerol flippase/synthetase MprF [Streptococcus suis]CYV30799.1 lysyl-tRNA synthetase [Streptococcus suis]